MVSLEEQSTARTQLLQVLDDLALQVMVQGGEALSPAAFANLTKLAERCDLTEFAKAVKSAKPGKGKSMTDVGARAVIEKLQAIIATPTEHELKEAAKAAAAVQAESFAFEEDPELLADFVMESEEHLTAIEEKILLLEKDPTLMDTIHAVFRSFHSIKGLAGFLGLAGVQTVAHEVETLLDHARNSRISVTSDVVDLVLESSEYLKEEVAVVDAKLNGMAIPLVRDNTNLIRVLSAATADIAAGHPFTITDTKRAAIAPAAVAAVAGVPPAPVEASKIEAALPEVPRTAIATPTPTPQPVAAAATPPAEKQARTESASTSIRVETSKLDRLMDMVGEMVIAQAILSNSRGGVNGEITQLARITSEVQRCAMSMRMMPIGPLFQKNAKMVRDLSRRNGKQVSLELLGESTELDKTIAEELADPLLHMIRNALDHGIEAPDERIAAGKTPMASLRISAEHQAGQIVISIADDGRGLDLQRIRNKAIQNGLIEEAAQLTEEEIFI